MTDQDTVTLDATERDVIALLDSGVPESRIILVDQHPDYPDNLSFEPLDETSRGLFLERHKDWVSRYLILNGLHLADQFIEALEKDGYHPVWTPSAQAVREDVARWNAPLDIEGYTLKPFQTFSMNRALERARGGQTNTDRFWFWNWAAGSGKAEPVSEPVLTPTGWRTMGDLRPGDQVIGSDGRATSVIAVHPQGVRSVYRVEFNDKTFVRCDGDHLWNVRKSSTRRRGPSLSDPTRKERIEEAPWKTLTTKEIMVNLPERGKHRWQIPALETVHFSPLPESLPLPPYMLGVLLGDGCFRADSIHTDKEIIDQFGWNRVTATETEHTAVAMVPASIRRVLKDMGLWGQFSYEKHVPENYLRSSAAERLALLQGLLDTDGHAYSGKTGVEFSTTSEALRDQVADLVRGLRGRATISSGRITKYTDKNGDRIPGRQSWRVSIVFPPDVMPFRLSRKAQAYCPPVQRQIPNKIISNVFDEGMSEEQVCITVAAQNNLYVTRGHNVTHNSHCSGAGALELFNHDDVDLVIACTLSKLKINLCRTFQAPAGLDAVVTDGTKAKRRKMYAAGHQVYVMNYEKLWHDEEDLTTLIAGKRVLWVLDEASKLITDSTPNKSRQALDRMVRACHAIVWPMSATVVGGNPLRYRDVFSLDGQEGHNPLSTKTDFIQRYADRVRNVPMKTRTGRSFGFTTYDWNLVKLQEIRHRVGDWTMAVRKTDPGVREQFRGIETIPMYVQATPGTEQLLGLILDSARQARDKGESLAHHYLAARIACINPAALLNSKSEVAADILAQRPDLFDATHSGKIEVLNGMLEGVREAQDKAVVFCHWTELGLLPLAPHLTVPHVLHYATGQSAAESQAAQDRFKTDPDITAFCSSDAGTYGLNLQEARYVISVDPTYSYDDLAQRNARIDRTDSHLDGLTAYVLITEDSVEERIWQICNERRALAAAVQGTSEELSYSSSKTPDEAKNLEWLLFGEAK